MCRRMPTDHYEQGTLVRWKISWSQTISYFDDVLTKTKPTSCAKRISRFTASLHRSDRLKILMGVSEMP